MRILVVGQAAFGEVFVADRLDSQSRPRHLVSVLTDEDMGSPHDVFTCTSLEQAIRYLQGLPFDLVFADGPLGEQVMAWIAVHARTLPKVPGLRPVGSMTVSGILEGFDVRPLRGCTADALRSALSRQPG